MSSAQAPAPAVNQGEDSLARFVPAEKLALYIEFQGLDAHAQAWRRSAAYKLLNETTLGTLFEEIAKQGIDAVVKRGGVDKAKVTEGVALFETIGRRGFMVSANAVDERQWHGLLVIRGGEGPDLFKTIDRMIVDSNMAKEGAKTITREGRSIKVVGDAEDGVAYWSEKGDMVLCAAGGIAKYLAAIDGKVPSAKDHPLRAELAKADSGFEPVAFGFADLSVTPPLPKPALDLGLGALKRFEFRWGFQDDALMSVVRIVAPGPREGIPALIDQPTFDMSTLPPLPSGLTGYTVFSVDLPKTYDRMVTLLKAEGPGQASKVEAWEKSVRDVLGFDLRKDLLSHLGPKVAFYFRPTGGVAFGPTIPFLNSEITAQVKDQMAVGKALDRVIDVLNLQLKAPAQAPGRPAAATTPRFRKVDGPRPAYSFLMPPGALLGPLASLSPTAIVGKDELVISARKPWAEQALALAGGEGARWAPDGPFAPMARQIPKGLIYLNVNDPRETLPTLIGSIPGILQMIDQAMKAEAAKKNPGGEIPDDAGLPINITPDQVPQAEDVAKFLFPGSFSIATDAQGIQFVSRDSFPSLVSPASGGVLVALLLPAVQSAREAARRIQCSNNLKQIGLALHNYESAHGAFPAAAITHKEGKPLLSWRVELLPFLGEKELYDQFNRLEPWDSPHNRKLLQSRPAVYACPTHPGLNRSETTYRGFVGNGAFWNPTGQNRLVGITDGTSNTIAVVEASEAVPWTKPDDIRFDVKQAEELVGAGSFHPGGFNVLFGDASVRFLPLSIAPEVFRALITRDGGEAIAPGSF